MESRAEWTTSPVDQFRHRALLYSSEAEFLDGTVPFVRQGLTNGEPILIVLSGSQFALLRDSLGIAADEVVFADMTEVGRNPASIIPVWRRFVADHTENGGRCRGVGEPVWPQRSRAELLECMQHEYLLNRAFGGGVPWHLLCPYDAGALAPDIIAGARRTHPFLVERGIEEESREFEAPGSGSGRFSDPLPEPSERPRELRFVSGRLGELRRLVASEGRGAGLDPPRCEDLVLAVNELATNSLRFAGGGGRLRVWQQDGSLVCEVRDSGRISDPMVGRETPQASWRGGFGLWLVNQLCDLVQIRSSDQGTVVRLHQRLG